MNSLNGEGLNSASPLTALKELGFRRAAQLDWTEDDIEFQFSRWTPDGERSSVLYAYVDMTGNRLLYIGQTGGTFKDRSSGYKSWINGRDKNRNSPINGAWLNCLLGECISSKVEIWVKKYSPDVRENEESKLITSLSPVLNTKA
jgi:hypothetical protein